MNQSTVKKNQQNVETEKKHSYVYQDIYDELNELGENALILVQPFKLNNNADIVKGIDFWRNEVTKGSSDQEKAKANSMVMRYKNIMELRIGITEDLMSLENPVNFVEFGPHQKEEAKTETEKKEIKTIKHPASKDKKTETVNEKVGKEIEKTKEEKVDKDKETKSTDDGRKTDYDKLHPTDEKKVEALNKIIPSLEEKLKSDKDDRALSQLKFHLKSYGEDKKHFATMDQMKSLLHWVKEGKFVHLSPLHILRDQKLSIADIVTEAEKLVKEDGLNRGQLKDYMKYYVMDNELKEYTEDKIIRTKEEYDNFFQKSMDYLFDETDERNKSVKSEPAKEEKKEEEKPEDRKTILSNLYDLHKKIGIKSVVKTATDFIEYFTTQGKELTRKASLNETIEFLKSHDPKMYKEYMANKAEQKEPSGGNTEKTSKGEIKEEPKETIKIDVKDEKVDNTPSKTDSTNIEKVKKEEKAEEKKELSAIVFPKLEEQLKYKGDRKINLTEFLITIVNKHINPIGTRKDGIDKQIEDLTTLAKKAILEIGLKKEEDGKSYDDWTEKDVIQYMAEEVVPFITDEYKILASTNDLELQDNLGIYIEKYPAGKEKERNEKLKEVLVESEIPRTKFASKVARKLRKGNFVEINEVINKITTAELEKSKEEVKK